jgi:hypothetical protein
MEHPGTITGVITVAVAHAKLHLPVTALVAVGVATVVLWIVMVLVARGGTRARGGLLRDTATPFMGLIVLAMGVQFALTGSRDFFLGWQTRLVTPGFRAAASRLARDRQAESTGKAPFPSRVCHPSFFLAHP